MIRLLVVHEARVFCKVIAAALGQEPDIQVVGSATTVDQALKQAPLSDVVLVCTSLPEDGALSFTRAVRKVGLSVKVLVMGLPKSDEAILACVEAGVDGYILQDDSMEELLKNLRAVWRGEALASPAVVAALMARVAQLADLQAELGPAPDSNRCGDGLF